MSKEKVQIRDYKNRDLKDVLFLLKKCFPENIGDFNSQIDGHQPGCFFVGEKDGKIITLIIFGHEEVNDGWIRCLAVDPIYQKQGIGKMMIETAENRLTSLGCKKTFLWVNKDNNNAISLYNKLGFRPSSESICMEKSLKELSLKNESNTL